MSRASVAVQEEGTPATDMWKQQFGFSDAKQKEKHMEEMLQVWSTS